MKLKKPIWYNKNLDYELNNFLKLYSERPIKNNIHGIRINHAFAIYFILKKIQPEFIIESGIYRGQSTWLIEKTLPKAKILSIDLNLNNRIYISNKVKYSKIDFKDQNFDRIPKNTLAFFDDHQPHIERLMQCKNFKIMHMIFEDNYIKNQGDFYTLNHLLKNLNFIHKPGKLSLIKTFYIFLQMILKKIINQNYIISMDTINYRIRDRIFFKNFKNYLKNNVDEIYTFPKIKLINKNKKIKRYIFKNFFNEINFYNYITYVKIKNEKN